MKLLYDARPSNIRPFMDRMKLHISELDLPNVHIQQRNLFLFQPWNTPRFHYINPFASYSKSTVAPVVFKRVFSYHRSQYSSYSTIYTDGSKRADYVGFGVVIEDVMHGYRLDTSCSIFTAEAVAIYRALQLIDSNMPRKYSIYTDSMSILEALENYNDRCHPVVCKIHDITSRLYSKGLDIVFCWLPSQVGIIGNKPADSAAKSATTHLPLAVKLSDMKRVIMHHIFKIWQESWSQQLDNKLHSVKPVIGAWPVMPMRRTDVKLTRLRIGHTRFTHRGLLSLVNTGFTNPGIGAWPVMPMRRTDVKLTRLRIGHTRFTHRHLLLGEDAPECPSCKCQRFGHSQTSCRGQLTCSRYASVGHASTDCSLEPKCINCLQPHPSDSKLCPKWKIEKQIQEIKTTQNISYPEARKLIVPQLPQTYAQATKSSTLNNSTQTDENITKINCPPLKLLVPLSSKQRTNIPTAIATSSSAQTQLLPSISSKKSTISNPQPPTPMSKTKGKIKEQPSQLHRPRNDNMKNRLNAHKTYIQFKEKS
ncbi:RNase H domain-containing protein [Trichonephila clavipes]|nr:RNase H domain-containing protein [Trichonephila clavipes]